MERKKSYSEGADKDHERNLANQQRELMKSLPGRKIETERKGMRGIATVHIPSEVGKKEHCQ